MPLDDFGYPLVNDRVALTRSPGELPMKYLQSTADQLFWQTKRLARPIGGASRWGGQRLVRPNSGFSNSPPTIRRNQAKVHSPPRKPKSKKPVIKQGQ